MLHNRHVQLPLAAAMLVLSTATMASSHREAPFITENPKVDGSDFYMFRSYGSGEENTVTFIANYLPLQDAYGGPNYFDLDPDAIYEIHIDNDGDAMEDITFRFSFDDVVNDLQVPVDGQMVSVPLKNIGAIGPTAQDTDNVYVRQTFTVSRIDGNPRSVPVGQLEHAMNSSTTFRKPLDNIGNKSISDYAAYAADHIYTVNIPGCSAGTGKLFVGQRKEGFAVNLGEVFDLVNTNPVGAPDGESNVIADKNVTSLTLQVPVSCLTSGDEPVIGAWTTASLRQARVLNPSPTAAAFQGNSGSGFGASAEGGAFTRVSRLGMPLVNEVVIGLKDKDRFNASHPSNDEQFLTYVTNPALPELLEILFGVTAPNVFPRNDLVSVFLTGVQGLNQPANVTGSEMLRLNTSIAPTPAGSQSNLGLLGSDTAGFPNGRRPGDDVVDIALRAAMGVLLGADPDAGSNDLPYTDGATVSDSDFDSTFPYLVTPLPGSPSN